jgi:hypothetical protein
MPIHHQFGRILFSEPLSIALSVGALYHFSKWVDTRKLADSAMAFVCFTLAVALKLEPLFLLFPLTWLWYRRHSLRIGEYAPFTAFVALALILPTAWYLYAFYLSRASIDVFGVVPFIQGHDKLQTLTMLRRPHFFLTMGHRIGDLAWGLAGAPLLCAGFILSLAITAMRPFLVYLAAVLIYFMIVAEGQIDAPYRQLNAVPVLSVFIALGAMALCSFVLRAKERTVTVFALVVVTVASLASYRRLLISNSDGPAHPWAWTLAQEIKKKAGPNDRLIMLGEYDVHVGGNDLSPVTYYYSGLRGWTLQPPGWSMQRVRDLIGRGATLFAVTREFGSVDLVHDAAAINFVHSMKEKYELLYENDGQVILRLAR